MSGAGNDFIIVDARKNSSNPNLELTPEQIANFSDRNNIGCDQFIIIRDSKSCDCLMEIYNTDGSKSESCGNATRCVASIICEEKSSDEIVIETIAGNLPCKKIGDEIEVKFIKPDFKPDFFYENEKFYTIQVGNPHAVCFKKEIPHDQEFQTTGKAIESHPFFPNKTNVEFAKIAKNNIIEVRVFERGVGETLACGSGACAVGAVAIKNKLVDSNKVITRFRGGDLTIEWNGDEGSPIVMTGDYRLLSEGELEV